MTILSDYLNINIFNMMYNHFIFKTYIIFMLFNIIKCYDTDYAYYNNKKFNINEELLINKLRMPKKSASMPNLSYVYSSSYCSSSSSPTQRSTARSISRTSSLTGSLNLLTMVDNKIILNKNILSIKKKLYETDLNDILV